MLYPGDTVNILLPILRADGVDPTVTSIPSITIIHVPTNTAVVTAQTMTLISGTQKVYKYSWSISGTAVIGEYLAIATWVADGVTYTGRYIKDFRVGDSRVTGVVALDSTVAKDGTVAKDATVAKASQLTALNPDNSSVVLAIKAKTDNLPASPASESTLTAVQSQVTEIHDAEFGEVVLDKTVSPQVVTVRKVSDNSVLKQFEMTDGNSETRRHPI